MTIPPASAQLAPPLPRQMCVLATNLADMQRQIGPFGRHHLVACDIDATVLEARPGEDGTYPRISGTDIASLQPVESSTVSFIRGLQDEGVPVFALTARRADDAIITSLQLHDAGVDFSRTDPFAYPVRLHAPMQGSHFEGIVYSDRRRKGCFIPNVAAHYPGHHLVMIDDSAEMLLSAMQAATMHAVPFTGVLYLGAQHVEDARRAQRVWNAYRGSDAERLGRLAGY